MALAGCSKSEGPIQGPAPGPVMVPVQVPHTLSSAEISRASISIRGLKESAAVQSIDGYLVESDDHLIYDASTDQEMHVSVIVGPLGGQDPVDVAVGRELATYVARGQPVERLALLLVPRGATGAPLVLSAGGALLTASAATQPP